MSRKNGEKRAPTLVDLFSGGGGFSLGARQAGFRSAVAVDRDHTLTSSYCRNFPKAKLIHADIRRLRPEVVQRLLAQPIDGVIGGPPCQAFSEIGRSNPKDPRRHLIRHFFRLVGGIRPKFFIMENVPGLIFDRNIGNLTSGLEMLPKNYAVLDPLILNSQDFGAPTSRERVFVVGFDRDRMDTLDADLFDAAEEPATVREAIGDLRRATLVRAPSDGFDVWRHHHAIEPSSYARRLRGRAGTFTGHRVTAHSRDVLRRFAKIEPGERDPVGKHPRLKWNGQCPTLRAGTGADHGSYQAVRPIHPSEDRVITVREAARLQGFPDSFKFHPTTWHSFRMIGNSVSPIVARVILARIRKRLSDEDG